MSKIPTNAIQLGDEDGTYRPAYRGRVSHNNGSGHDGMSVQQRREWKITTEFIQANAWRRKFKAHMAAVREEVKTKDVQFAVTTKAIKPKVSFRDWRIALRSRDEQRARMQKKAAFVPPKTTANVSTPMLKK